MRTLYRTPELHFVEAADSCIREQRGELRFVALRRCWRNQVGLLRQRAAVVVVEGLRETPPECMLWLPGS